MGTGYLCHLTFTLSKFTLKSFLFLEMVFDTMVLVFEDFLCLFFFTTGTLLAITHTDI